MRVHNKKDRTAPPDAVYVGRGSLFGNPFVLGRDGNRDEVCDKYEEYVRSNPRLVKAIKKELKGKDLVCFCAPERCHADFLLRVANEW